MYVRHVCTIRLPHTPKVGERCSYPTVRVDCLLTFASAPRCTLHGIDIQQPMDGVSQLLPPVPISHRTGWPVQHALHLSGFGDGVADPVFGFSVWSKDRKLSCVWVCFALVRGRVRAGLSESRSVPGFMRLYLHLLCHQSSLLQSVPLQSMQHTS